MKVMFCIDTLPPYRERGYLAGYRETSCGSGEVKFTDREDEALRFPDFSSAMAFWRQQSRVMPKRPDGKPNRPLTAFTVEIRDERDPHPPLTRGAHEIPPQAGRA